MTALIRSLVALMAASVLCAFAAEEKADAPAFSIKREFQLMAPMRDGIKLSTDVYRPDVAEKVPAILVRTPYTRTLSHFFTQGQYWANQGYAYVIQDVRGRGDSEGVMNPLAQETFDGYDAQSWVAQQPWSNGKVVMMGNSYSGWTQVLPASLNNPVVKAMIPSVTPPDPGRYWPHRNGAVNLGMIEWIMITSGRTDRSFSGSEDEMLKAYLSAPIKDIDSKIGLQVPIWQDYLANLHNEDYWESRNYQHRLHESTIPMLHLTGWYDGTLGGALQNFPIMSQKASAEARDNQYLVVGPWRHWVDRDSTVTNIGDVDFGENSLMDLPKLYDTWFKHHLGDSDNEVTDWPRVRLFVMNGNRWINTDDWPVPGTQYTKFYLSDKDVLSPEQPAASEGTDQYTYDPADPTPFIWKYSVDSGGPDNYAEVDKRSDVLVYNMPTAEETTTVCGPITANLYAASSAKDTDWIARLSLVHPDGYVQRLTEGWMRARARNGEYRNDPLTPGKVEHYKLDLWGTCVDVSEGYSLRLTVMSAAFPMLALNFNTDEDIGSASEGVVAEQTIYRSAEYPSSVTLPIVNK